jgi:hypothetical protein
MLLLSRCKRTRCALISVVEFQAFGNAQAVALVTKCARI